MKILGLDPGTATTGYGLVELVGEQPVMRDYGCILTPKEHAPAVRLLDIHHQLIGVLGQTKPDHVIVEKLFFATNTRTAMAVSEARGVILMTLCKLEMPFTELTPMQVKQRVVGNGRADKKMVQASVVELLSLLETPRPDDAADALALAICGIWIHQGLADNTVGEERKKMPVAHVAGQIAIAKP